MKTHTVYLIKLNSGSNIYIKSAIVSRLPTQYCQFFRTRLTGNLSKAHMMHDSSGSTKWAIVYSAQ